MPLFPLPVICIFAMQAEQQQAVLKAEQFEKSDQRIDRYIDANERYKDFVEGRLSNLETSLEVGLGKVTSMENQLKRTERFADESADYSKKNYELLKKK